MYEMKIVHGGVVKDYETLHEIVRNHVEEKARKTNVTVAKAGGGGTGLVGKGKGRDASLKAQAKPKAKTKAPGACHQWAEKGHALEAFLVPG